MRAVRLPSSRAVRAAIVASLRHGDASLDSTAHALKISGRTLQRHLERIGTSHSKMLAEVRLKIACRLLADSSKSLSDIAKFLGCTNASSFSRSFSRLMKFNLSSIGGSNLAASTTGCILADRSHPISL
ncbi:helix-turn-helix domain-containing protein [Bradyrhizobium sp. PUT101]|uniref:helix-turn-helix domain-containing protein n=1 Tax=Bradyrhizobium sp. PUT101 TaxID=3447427 RepID=UPI003F8461CB